MGIPVSIFVSTQPVETGEAYWWSYIKKANKTGVSNIPVESLKKLSNDQRIAVLDEVKKKVNIDREALTKEELVDISNGGFISIGSHTVTHPILTNCSDEKALFEISESKKLLEQWLNRKVDTFAFPNGNFSAREIGFLKKSDYRVSFTTQTGYLTKQCLADLFTLPRFEVYESGSFAENICRMVGVWFNHPLIKIKK
jgi:peptidoglycan/xylan/chitin deacetylase (PgdA/CDA1 family)